MNDKSPVSFIGPQRNLKASDRLSLTFTEVPTIRRAPSNTVAGAFAMDS